MERKLKTEQFGRWEWAKEKRAEVFDYQYLSGTFIMPFGPEFSEVINKSTITSFMLQNAKTEA